MKTSIFIIVALFTSVLQISCQLSNTSEDSLIFPMFVDENENQVNDYYEFETHQGVNHSFIDLNNDDLCDYAQDGSSTWHGPGFVDTNKNEICDFWDTDQSIHMTHEGMRFHDSNENGVNDYFEEFDHSSDTHFFEDLNTDNICDRAQDGSPTWHGPGFVDTNKNGISDHWDEGGRGHGIMMMRGRN